MTVKHFHYGYTFKSAAAAQFNGKCLA
uniref:Uncharacterized protein n=1 Tax=Anguilla anguilla TaxID=7936 RepID=A0A0E9UFT3_ANGAN